MLCSVRVPVSHSTTRRLKRVQMSQYGIGKLIPEHIKVQKNAAQPMYMRAKFQGSVASLICSST